MPEKLYGLTEAQRDFLQDLLDESRARRKNTTNRFAPSEPPFSGSEAYIALTPAGGIPALTTAGTGTGTGIGGAFDVAGSADCNIYKIFQYKDLGNIGSLKKTVYNLSESDIPGDIYITVIKDKSGKWLAQTGGGGSSSGNGESLIRVTSFGFRSADNTCFYYTGFVQQLSVSGTIANKLVLTDGLLVYVNFPNLDRGTGAGGSAPTPPYTLSAIPMYVNCVPTGLVVGNRDLWISNIGRHVIDFNAAMCRAITNA